MWGRWRHYGLALLYPLLVLGALTLIAAAAGAADLTCSGGSEVPSHLFLVTVSSIAFSLWHLSAVALHTGFDLPPTQIPVFLVNAAAMGAVWGLTP